MLNRRFSFIYHIAGIKKKAKALTFERKSEPKTNLLF